MEETSRRMVITHYIRLVEFFDELLRRSNGRKFTAHVFLVPLIVCTRTRAAANYFCKNAHFGE